MTDGRGGGTLKITGAHVHFDRTKALDGVNLAVGDGGDASRIKSRVRDQHYEHLPRSTALFGTEIGGGGRESNPPDGDRPSHPL